jgi:hypothetical protein
MLRNLRKGQSTAEYAIVIGLVIAAAVAMQVYVKRGIQAKMHDATDFNDSSATMLTTKQYEPDYATTTNMVSKRDVIEATTTTKGGGVTRAITGADVSQRTGTTNVAAAQ